MRTLILGGSGMLGKALVASGRERGWPTLALPRRHADIRDAARVRFWCEDFRPQVVVNSAAYTKVDLCEGEGREEAFAVNADAVATVAAESRRVGARLVQISSDYVFAGDGHDAYREDSPTGPISVYGESKLRGEQAALVEANSLVVRASWLFGPDGPNFAATIVRLIMRGDDPLRVVDDQVGAPTYTPFLARAILDLAASGAQGLVHYRNHPACSWYAFAVEIARAWPVAGKVTRVEPTNTAAMSRPAARPPYSVLDVQHCERLLGRPVEPWLGGLAEYLDWMRQGRSR
jgi:dTDP-4-dehydrorhamnose reductase